MGSIPQIGTRMCDPENTVDLLESNRICKKEGCDEKIEKFELDGGEHSPEHDYCILHGGVSSSFKNGRKKNIAKDAEKFLEVLERSIKTKKDFQLEGLTIPILTDDTLTKFIKLINRFWLGAKFSGCEFKGFELKDTKLSSLNAIDFEKCLFLNKSDNEIYLPLAHYWGCEFSGSVIADLNIRGNEKWREHQFDEGCKFNDLKIISSSPLKENKSITDGFIAKCKKIEISSVSEEHLINNSKLSDVVLTNIGQNEKLSLDVNYSDIKSIAIEGFHFEKKSCIKVSNSKAKIILKNCSFAHDFNLSTDEKSTLAIKIEGCTFSKQFEVVRGSKIESFEMTNSRVDETGVISSVTFNDLAIFKHVVFGYVVDFSYSHFHKGLDISSVRFKETEYLNCLGAKVSDEETPRETFRMIKHAFDKVGNHIEANDYHALEMKQYKKEMKGSKFSQKKLVFWLNEKTSNFGQSYLDPLYFLLLFSVLHMLVECGYEKEYLYKIYPDLNPFIETLSNFLNGLASKVMPFQSLLDKNKGFEFFSLLFYIIQSVFIWQVIVAVKRHTKR